MFTPTQKCLSHLTLQRCPLNRVPPVAEDASIGLDGISVICQSLAICRYPSRLVPCLKKVVLRFVPFLSLDIMVGQHTVKLLQSLRKEILNNLGNPHMEFTPFLQEDAFIGCFLHQGMLEDIFQFGDFLLLADQLHAFQLIEIYIEFLHSFVDPFEYTIKEGTSDHRRAAEHLFKFLVEPIHPGHDHALDCIGDGDPFNEGRGPPAIGPCVTNDRTTVDQGAYDLLQEKRITLSPVDNYLSYPCG